MGEYAVARRQDLRADGWTDARIARALRSGGLIRVGRDRYVRPGEVPDLAQVLARPGTATALGHATAARAYGLPADDPRTHLVVARGCRRRGRPARGAVVHQTYGWSAVEVDGVLVTDPVTTVVDILRTRPVGESVAVADAALRTGLVELGDLWAAVAGRRIGVLRARAALALVDGRSESPLESRLRVVLTLDGQPPDDLQVTVREAGDDVARVDVWYDLGLIAEADGFEFHQRREDYVADRRKAQAFARLGLVLVRFSWEDVMFRPEEVCRTVAQVRCLLGGAGCDRGTAGAAGGRNAC